MKVFWKNFNVWFGVFMLAAVAIIVACVLCSDDLLGWVSNALQVVTVAIAMAAWFSAKSTMKARKKELEKACKAPQQIVLIVDIGGKVIRNQVLDYAKENGIPTWKDDKEKGWGDLPKNFTVTECASDDDQLQMIHICSGAMPVDPKNQEETVEFKDNLCGVINNIAYKMRINNVSTIHLFYTGPVALTYYLGQSFKNSFEKVIVYHYVKVSGKDAYIPII